MGRRILKRRGLECGSREKRSDRRRRARGRFSNGEGSSPQSDSCELRFMGLAQDDDSSGASIDAKTEVQP